MQKNQRERLLFHGAGKGACRRLLGNDESRADLEQREGRQATPTGPRKQIERKKGGEKRKQRGQKKGREMRKS